jgi:hypothetical protein
MSGRPQIAAVLVAFLAAMGVFFSAIPAAADAGHCTICGGLLGDTVYTVKDKLTGEEVIICQQCVKARDVCFVCGLPVVKNATRLPDGRVLCERDAKTAVVDEDEAKHICSETIDDVNRLLARFVSFPVTNVEMQVVDRVSLMSLFKIPGNDYECPNVLGYTHSETNHGQIKHTISLMSALTAPEYRALSAHEISHAWVAENVPAARRRTLGQDAHEGFCELVAYLLMDATHDDEQKRAILKNAYTRGQIHLFVDAEQRYGFNDVVEWMQYGVYPFLDRDDPTRLRVVHPPSSRLVSAAVLSYSAFPAPPVPPSRDTLMLNGILDQPGHSVALINDRAFVPGEEADVRVAGTNATIRCLAIGVDSVRVQVLNTGEERKLWLKDAEEK